MCPKRGDIEFLVGFKFKDLYICVVMDFAENVLFGAITNGIIYEPLVRSGDDLKIYYGATFLDCLGF